MNNNLTLNNLNYNVWKSYIERISRKHLLLEENNVVRCSLEE